MASNSHGQSMLWVHQGSDKQSRVPSVVNKTRGMVLIRQYLCPSMSQLSNTYDAANACQEAANCYKAVSGVSFKVHVSCLASVLTGVGGPRHATWQINPEDAIASFRKAAGYLTELGKFKQIGKIHQQIAEVRTRGAFASEKRVGLMEALSGALGRSTRRRRTTMRRSRTTCRPRTSS